MTRAVFACESRSTTVPNSLESARALRGCTRPPTRTRSVAPPISQSAVIVCHSDTSVSACTRRLFVSAISGSVATHSLATRTIGARHAALASASVRSSVVASATSANTSAPLRGGTTLP
jgi:hypothetical protein